MGVIRGVVAVSIVLSVVILSVFVFAAGNTVTICHVPRGNFEKSRTLTINEKALNKHLNHGDYLGACQPQGGNFGVAWQEALSSATSSGGSAFQECCEGSDITRDTRVDLSDLSLLAAYWQQTCPIMTNFCQGADINRDFIINLNDLSSLASNWQRTDCSPLPLGYYTCCMEEGTCFGTTVDNCRASGGVVSECVPTPRETGTPVPGVNASHAPINTSNPALATWLTNLTTVVTATGVNNTKYNATAWDCDDFAHSLETNLTAAGYHATYTYYWCRGPPAWGHAITDVHAPDGSIVWIEPQTGKVVNIDFDGDGQIERRDNEHVDNVNAVTDDNCAIEVFEDSAAAAAAGAPRD